MSEKPMSSTRMTRMFGLGGAAAPVCKGCKRLAAAASAAVARIAKARVRLVGTMVVRVFFITILIWFIGAGGWRPSFCVDVPARAIPGEPSRQASAGGCGVLSTFSGELVSVSVHSDTPDVTQGWEVTKRCLLPRCFRWTGAGDPSFRGAGRAEIALQ